MAIGTFWMFSDRRCAVTTISWMPPEASDDPGACWACWACTPNAANTDIAAAMDRPAWVVRRIEPVDGPRFLPERLIIIPPES